MFFLTVIHREEAGRLERMFVHLLVGVLQTALAFLFGTLMLAVIVASLVLSIAVVLPAAPAPVHTTPAVATHVLQRAR